MRTMMAIVAGAVLVAGCGGASDPGSEAEPAAAKTPAAFSEVQKKIIALPKRLQDGVMLRAIRDAKLTCQSVTELTRVEDRGGKARWRVVCDDREPYVVEITPDGTAQIRSRS